MPASLLCGLSTIVGCSGAPQVAPVEGVVKLDGKPVAGALVIFEPEGESPIQSTGVTDELGQFRLRSNDGREGAVVGSHRVVVRGASSFAVATDKEADEVAPVSDSAGDAIPADYLRVDRTPLRQEITADANTVTLELSSGTISVDNPAPE
jgi:hypothetical protein